MRKFLSILRSSKVVIALLCRSQRQHLWKIGSCIDVFWSSKDFLIRFQILWQGWNDPFWKWQGGPLGPLRPLYHNYDISCPAVEQKARWPQTSQHTWCLNLPLWDSVGFVPQNEINSDESIALKNGLRIEKNLYWKVLEKPLFYSIYMPDRREITYHRGSCSIRCHL